MKTINKERQSKITPGEALEILKDGNHRFVNNLKINRNLLQQVNETKEGQFPFAVILSCIDSRTSAELIFDQGLGDVFSIRVAGAVLNDDVLGSMEFACKLAGSKIVVVLSHTHCGAVKEACEGVKMGYVTQLLAKLQPAIEKTFESKVYRVIDNKVLNKVAENHVHITINTILQRSPILKSLVDEGKIGVVGGMYNIESGEVDFYEEDIRMQGKDGCRKPELA